MRVEVVLGSPMLLGVVTGGRVAKRRCLGLWLWNKGVLNDGANFWEAGHPGFFWKDTESVVITGYQWWGECDP